MFQGAFGAVLGAALDGAEKYGELVQGQLHQNEQLKWTRKQCAHHRLFYSGLLPARFGPGCFKLIET